LHGSEGGAANDCPYPYCVWDSSRCPARRLRKCPNSGCLGAVRPLDKVMNRRTTSDERPTSPFTYPDLAQGGFGGLWTQLGNWSEGPHSYWLTRFAILRLLGLVYFMAFLSLANQVVPLIGNNGLLPTRLYLHQAENYFGSRLS